MRMTFMGRSVVLKRKCKNCSLLITLPLIFKFMW